VSVLAIDTASRSRVVAVVASPDGTRIRGVVIRGEGVATSLTRAIAPLLALVVLRAVVVVTGPGSYTGVRAGMAGALGLAQARDLPLYGIGSLEVIAASPDSRGDRDVWVAADAGRGALYVARAASAATPRRVIAAAFDAGGARVLSTEPLDVEGLELIDPVRALAQAVVPALSRPALDRAGLTAVYVG
jgi:tRNA threonylcarbamoyl adenosine modification protein YeaZ